MGPTGRLRGSPDLALTIVLVVAAGAEVLWRSWGAAALLALRLPGIFLPLTVLLRRGRPQLAIWLFVGIAMAGTLVERFVGPQTEREASALVPILCLVVLVYSLGVYATPRAAIIGGLAPLALVTVVDTGPSTTRSLLSGLVYFAAIVVGMPLVAGRLVRARRQLAAALVARSAACAAAAEARASAAAEQARLRLAADLDAALVGGLEAMSRGIVDILSHGGSEAEVRAVEDGVRELIGRTRAVVVGLHRPIGAAEAQPVLPAPPVMPGPTVGQLALRPEGWGSWPCRGVVAGVVGVWAVAAARADAAGPLPESVAAAALIMASTFLVAYLGGRVVGVVGLVLVAALAGVSLGGTDLLGVVALALAAWGAGLAFARQSRAVAEEQRTADLRAAQSDSLALASQARTRAFVASEVHDAIGHSLTAAALQAGAARRMWSTDPARALDVLQTVHRTLDEGLQDLRCGLADRAGNANQLLARVRAAGLPVRVDGALPTLLDPVAHRVLQEALTNAMRYAPGSATRIVVEDRHDATVLRIVNAPPTEPAPSTPGSGSGLTGMRRRVEEAGGVVDWGPRRDGGFAVEALLRRVTR